MTDKELIETLIDALESAETQLDQISGLMEDDDVEFFDAHNEVIDALRIARELKEKQSEALRIARQLKETQ